MLGFDAIIFDFDGVLLESEFEGNRQLAEAASIRCGVCSA
jgi:beta-phosphoglucomutase-like phosphatase (HAD superfamily)